MFLDYGFVIDRGDRGFKNFIKYTMQKVEMIIGNFECNGIERIKEQPNSYALAKMIKGLFVKFLNELDDNKKELLKELDMEKLNKMNIWMYMVRHITYVMQNGKESSSKETSMERLINAC